MEDIYKKYNYPSAVKFYKILKLNNMDVTQKQVNEFVENQTVHQVHKRVTESKSKQKFIFALEPFEMMQIDLLDYQKYSRKNNGYKFILIAIDIFTRKAFAEPIKSKTPDDVLDAFKKMKIKDLTSVYHDSGNEFKGSFLQYLDEHNIHDLKAPLGDHNSLGVVDRFSKTFKNMIAKYMTAEETTKYYKSIQDLINIYNETPHSSINNITPDKALERENYLIIKRINELKLKYNKSISNTHIKAGDFVRKKLKKKLFEKGYEQTYSNKIYEVILVVGDKITLNDGKSLNAEDVLRVNKTQKTFNSFEKDEAEKNNKMKRHIRKEGLDYDSTDDDEPYWHRGSTP